MDRDGGVGQHGLGPRRRDGQPDGVVVAQRITDVIELPFRFLPLHFNV